MLITVADHGPGIPLEKQEHIFEKFYRVKGTGPMATAREVFQWYKERSGLAVARVCCRTWWAYLGAKATRRWRRILVHSALEKGRSRGYQSTGKK